MQDGGESNTAIPKPPAKRERDVPWMTERTLPAKLASAIMRCGPTCTARLMRVGGTDGYACGSKCEGGMKACETGGGGGGPRAGAECMSIVLEHRGLGECTRDGKGGWLGRRCGRRAERQSGAAGEGER